MNKIDVVKQMAESNPENGSAWYLLGLEYAQINKNNEALQAFTQALRYSDHALQQQIIVELGKIASANTTSSQSSISQRSMPQKAMVGASEATQEVDNQEQLHDDHNSFQVIPGGQVGRRDKVKDHVTFEDVGGLHEVKNAIHMKIIKPFVSPGLFELFKKKIGGGILLYGPPGCGKTFIAKATAGECRARFVPIHISDILDPYIGASEQNLREIFSSARANKPSVLFLDEMDALGYNRSRASSNTMRTVVDTLLTEIEGIDTSTDKMLIIGATNMPWDVDPAFKRPGRFDKMIFVSPPDEEARKTIFQIKLAERPVVEIDYDWLAKETDLYSGADIENVVEIATEMVIAEIMKSGVERPIQMNDLKQSIASTHPSTIDWLRTVKNYVKYANQGGLYNDVESFLSRYKRI
ncbi:AAA family ATPase [Brevibacillus sp. HB1.2]|uniref:AAA family ATPase n=1 Tax=Brevibacillus TaxID=55080 RepID=UPI00156B88AE|nr:MULTISPECIES: AAA family ATPase [unclassified Brevibacillus]NRS17684.1 AAA family ATPase [Brevibacillus sp. HB1.4B]NTU22979.1 AAA family ATPase [Brevibacillus sp. HB1.2]